MAKAWQRKLSALSVGCRGADNETISINQFCRFNRSDLGAAHGAVGLNGDCHNRGTRAYRGG